MIFILRKNSLERGYNEEIPPGPGDPGFMNPTNVPTMSEWGLLAVAVIVGLIGIVVARRKQQLS